MAIISPSRALGALFGPVGRAVSFGFITDLHHDPVKEDAPDDQGGKYYQDSADKLTDIVAAFNTMDDLAFVFQNGDFIDGSADAATALTDLTDITGIFAGCNVPQHHNIGNHEVTRLTKAQVIGVTGQPDKWYYFDRSGVRFIVLDGNFTADDDDADLETSAGSGASPFVSYIPPTQRAWLASTIEASSYPCVILCHYPVYYVGDDSWGLTNAAAVRDILEAAGNKVIGCVGGHLHDNFIRELNGIIYASVHAAVTGAYPSLNYAIVSVYPRSREIKVVSAGFDMSYIAA